MVSCGFHTFCFSLKVSVGIALIFCLSILFEIYICIVVEQEINIPSFSHMERNQKESNVNDLGGYPFESSLLI